MRCNAGAPVLAASVKARREASKNGAVQRGERTHGWQRCQVVTQPLMIPFVVAAAAGNFRNPAVIHCQ
jgi:hypothetical protein